MSTDRFIEVVAAWCLTELNELIAAHTLAGVTEGRSAAEDRRAVDAGHQVDPHPEAPLGAVSGAVGVPGWQGGATL